MKLVLSLKLVLSQGSLRCMAVTARARREATKPGMTAGREKGSNSFGMRNFHELCNLENPGIANLAEDELRVMPI